MKRPVLALLALLMFAAGPFGLGSLEHHAHHAGPGLPAETGGGSPSADAVHPECPPGSPTPAGSDLPAGAAGSRCAICSALHGAPLALGQAPPVIAAAAVGLRTEAPARTARQSVPAPVPLGRAPPSSS
jgi:hypothetical protein